MSIKIEYHQSEVLQALRFHFIKQTEIKALMVVVNVYAIATAILLYYQKIRPELFLLGSLLWVLLMLSFWYGLPIYFYKKTNLFKFDWTFSFNENGASLVATDASAEWKWKEVSHYFESPYFFHIYFGKKSFFLVPKSTVAVEDQLLLREYLPKN